MTKMRKWSAGAFVLAAAFGGMAERRALSSALAPSSGTPAACPARAASPAAMPPPLGAAGFDPAPYAHRTTSAAIATSNLNARIDSLTTWVRSDPSSSGARRALMDALLSRTQFFGTFSDFDRARELVHAPSRAAPVEELDAWAAVSGALHDFNGALGALDKAEARDGVSRAAQRTTLNLALGHDLDGVLATRAETARRAPTFESLSGLAGAEAALGRFEAADATYRQALSAYRDVSPFPVAWVQFQRGMMWAEMAGMPERAIPLYRDAVARLPGYVVANVHLAELEAKMGSRDRGEAIARLERLADTVEDPEPAGLLSTLVADTDPAQAARLRALAKRGYEALLAKHKEAFLDHAAEFFGGPGADPKRGLALAEENLKLRPTDRAYALAIRSAMAAGDGHRACALVRTAGSGRPSVPLRELRHDLEATCPRSDS